MDPPLLVAAPDKFRDSADAPAIAATIGRDGPQPRLARRGGADGRRRRGLVDAVEGVALEGIDLVAASDVLTPFTQAARIFGPQKGADAEAIARLTTRLERLAEHYRERFGVDVATITGAGVAGRAPVLVIAGSADAEALEKLPPGVEVASLVERYGERHSFAEPLALVGEVLGERLRVDAASVRHPC